MEVTDCVEGKAFVGVRFDSGDVDLRGLRLKACTFRNCYVGNNDPRQMPTVRRLTLEGCSEAVSTSAVRPVLLDEVTLDGFRPRDGMVTLWSPLLRHVIIQGRIFGCLKINAAFPGSHDDPGADAEFARMRQEHYAAVDWALDISRARFTDFDCRGVPADRFVLDHDTQAVVRRASFRRERGGGGLDGLGADFADRFRQVSLLLRMFLRTSEDDVVIAAPLGRPRAVWQPYVDAIVRLREIGVADAGS